MKNLTELAEHRAMVLLELDAGRIGEETALADLGCSVRHLRRLRERFRVGGAVALNHGNVGRVPWHAVDLELREQIVALAKDVRYFGANFHQFTEMLAEREGIVVLNGLLPVMSETTISGSLSSHMRRPRSGASGPRS